MVSLIFAPIELHQTVNIPTDLVSFGIMVGRETLVGLAVGFGVALIFTGVQLGSALVDMQKNVDDLQKNMGTLKQVKEQLTSLSPQGGGPPGGDLLKKGGDSLKDMTPKF